MTRPFSVRSYSVSGTAAVLLAMNVKIAVE